MNKERLKKFRRILESQRDQILLNNRVISEDFSVSQDDRFDEIDQATTDIEQSIRMRLKNRETVYIKKIDSALKRIEEGHFGECQECGEDIELRRLEARPTATLCVSCKEEQERRETQMASSREHFNSSPISFSRLLA